MCVRVCVCACKCVCVCARMGVRGVGVAGGGPWASRTKLVLSFCLVYPAPHQCDRCGQSTVFERGHPFVDQRWRCHRPGMRLSGQRTKRRGANALLQIITQRQRVGTSPGSGGGGAGFSFPSPSPPFKLRPAHATHGTRGWPAASPRAASAPNSRPSMRPTASGCAAAAGFPPQCQWSNPDSCRLVR